MITRFLTKSGSLYELNSEQMTWRRVLKTEKSGRTRKSNGRLIHWPVIEKGKSVLMFDDDVKPGALAHCVVTSVVVVIEEQQDLPLGEKNR